jgi:tetratricopeptide (TPR) repeat protein
MAIRGNLREASLADVLQLLALGQKTGVLSLACDRSFGAIEFDRGSIVHAAIVNGRDRLGDRLVRAGALAADALVSVQATLPDDDRALARALIDAGAAAPDLVACELRALVEEVVCQLFTWGEGTFSFEPRPAAAEAPLVHCSADSLLLEAARRVDEWTQIARKVPSLDLIFELDAARVQERGIALSEEQRRLAPWLDGTRDVAALVERTGLGEFAVGKALYGLVTAGFAHRVGRSAPPPAPAAEHRVAEHRNLGVAFARTGMLDEAAREFRRVLELRPEDADARHALAVVHLRRRAWDEAVAVLDAAARAPGASSAVLHTLARAHEGRGALAEADALLAEALRRSPAPDPRLALSQAIVALRAGDVPRAEERFATARAWWAGAVPVVSWFHGAGLAAALCGDLERAQRLLEDGLGHHPRATLLHNDLAVVQERRGLPEAAARTLEHALLVDSGLPHLHRNLGDCHDRAQRLDAAAAAWERAVRIAPAHGTDTWRRLGDLRYRRGDLGGARDAWREAVALDPGNARARAGLASDGGAPVEQRVA